MTVEDLGFLEDKLEAINQQRRAPNFGTLLFFCRVRDPPRNWKSRKQSADCKRGQKRGAARKCRKVSKNFLTLFDDF